MWRAYHGAARVLWMRDSAFAGAGAHRHRAALPGTLPLQRDVDAEVGLGTYPGGLDVIDAVGLQRADRGGGAPRQPEAVERVDEDP